MNPEDVKTLLVSKFPDADIEVEGDGRYFNLVLVSSQFEGLRTIKRQQLVYAALSDEIASGALHAVTMSTLTPAEQAAAV